MSAHEDEGKQAGIPDEDLPDDLVPGDDNPLAEGLPDGETVEGLLDESDDADSDAEDEASNGSEQQGGDRSEQA